MTRGSEYSLSIVLYLMSFSTPRRGRRYAAFLLLRRNISLTRMMKTFSLASRREGLPDSSTVMSDALLILFRIKVYDLGKYEMLGEVPKKSRDLVDHLKIDLDILRKK